MPLQTGNNRIGLDVQNTENTGGPALFRQQGSYSLVPVPLLLIPVTLLSNVCTTAEIDIIGFISTLSFVWLGLLIFFGTQVTHDYTMGKNVITILGTLVGMVFIMFLVLLFSTLVGKMVSLVTNIITELRYRM